MTDFFYFEDVNISKYHPFGRWLYIFHSLNRTCKSSPVLFWGAISGVFAFASGPVHYLNQDMGGRLLPYLIAEGLFLILAGLAAYFWITSSAVCA